MCSQPSASIDFGSGLGIVVVALHHQVSAGAQFALLADRQAFAGLRIDDLHLGVGQRRAYGGHAQFHGVVHARHGDHRRSLGLAVGDGHLAAVHPLGDAPHDFDGAGRARHHAVAQRVRSNRSKSGCSSSAMNMVGTP